MIPAFQVMYFPYLVYFAEGLPKTKMPLMLTSTTSLAEQWMDMMDQKYRRSQLLKHKGEKKVDLKKLKKEHRAKFKTAIDTDKDIYGSVIEHAKTELGYKKYHSGLQSALFHPDSKMRAKLAAVKAALSEGITKVDSVKSGKKKKSKGTGKKKDHRKYN